MSDQGKSISEKFLTDQINQLENQYLVLLTDPNNNTNPIIQISNLLNDLKIKLDIDDKPDTVAGSTPVSGDINKFKTYTHENILIQPIEDSGNNKVDANLQINSVNEIDSFSSSLGTFNFNFPDPSAVGDWVVCYCHFNNNFSLINLKDNSGNPLSVIDGSNALDSSVGSSGSFFHFYAYCIKINPSFKWKLIIPINGEII